MKRSWWKGLGSTAIDLVYPPHCPGCAELAEQDRSIGSSGLELCQTCQTELWPCEDPRCQVCGESFLPAGPSRFVCGTCRGQNFAFEFAVSPYQSKGVLRDMIHRFKYQSQLSLRPVLGQFLAEVLEDNRIRSLEPGWITVPVPLHPRRYREREFNQSLELCLELKRHGGIPIVSALRRTRYTPSQTHYRRDQRRVNLKGAFALKRWRASRVRGRTVALVDDVFTTGSTANECAAILRSAGAKKVVVITLARG
ncbi:MAG: competence protein ComFC [Verrucomicrobiales bacterium]|jgi:competence protein ComFC